MKIRVFQIDHENNINNLAFMNYDHTQAHGGVKAENYRQIYGGTVNCDSVGFKPIDFDISQTDHNDIMKILIVENGKAPYPAEIRHDIHAMQSVVGGSIEPIYFEPEGDALAWCNDEFLLNGSEPNRIVGNCLVHGTFYVSGNCQNEYGEWDCCSLTDEQIEQYSNEFKYPIIALVKMEMEDIEALCEDFEESEEPELSMS